MATARKKASPGKESADDQLARYRSMRDFGVTKEPSGAVVRGAAKNDAGLPFVIQKHAATALHYDAGLPADAAITRAIETFRAGETARDW